MGALIDAIDQNAMLAQVQAWSAINTGTANLEGLSRQWDALADAFAEALPAADCLVLNMVLHHLPAPASAIEHLAAAL